MRWAILVCLLCLGVTAGAAGEPNWGTWAEEVRKQHALAGSFYFPRSDPDIIGLAGGAYREGNLYRPLPPDGRGPVLIGWDILLLGEVHDNPMHHQIRAWLIQNRPMRTKSGAIWGAIVFEQIRTDQQPALDQFKALAEAGTADDLLRLLEWGQSGWPPAQIYKPLFEAALAAKLPIHAGDPPRGQVRAIARGGSASLPPEDRERLRLDEPMPAPLLDAVRAELAASHCGLLPPEAMGGMAEAQRYRDAHLADALLSAQQRHRSAILIAGNGHVRGDRGVPWHILQRAPKSQVTSVVIVEVEEGKTDPEAYVPRDPEGKPAADLVIFTPRAERGDPCEEMRRMKR